MMVGASGRTGEEVSAREDEGMLLRGVDKGGPLTGGVFAADVHLGILEGEPVREAIFVHECAANARRVAHRPPNIRLRQRGADQSDARSAGIFSRRTNRMHKARVYSHDGPIGCTKRGYILTTDQSDAGRAVIPA
eukprot:6519846-Pyramimonas_sp.AAC.1